ncbi:hypothetical protein K491DRAFT_756020 [Lophiostoma macrostomum CBS 122681]|uniref:Uncharacterized protein n=1 Tax=Lophiostoma macrostomum CBS 122681 TaxID=1314788 RepID=A0A6A6TFK8_9PLEO|nr:hypothetical protein K491DRAFT_756020 [Lophiostoma macrostomum CBS 122681]
MAEEKGDKFIIERLNTRTADMQKGKGKAREIEYSTRNTNASSSTPSGSRRLNTSSGSPMKMDTQLVEEGHEEYGEHDTEHIEQVSRYAHGLSEHAREPDSASVNSSLDLASPSSLEAAPSLEAASLESSPEGESAGSRESHHHVLSALLSDVSYKIYMLGTDWRYETYTPEVIATEFGRMKQEMRRLQWILKGQEDERISDLKRAIASDEKRDRKWKRIVSDTQEQAREVVGEGERLWRREVQRLQEEIMRLRDKGQASNSSSAPTPTVSRLKIRRRPVQEMSADESGASAGNMPYDSTHQSPRDAYQSPNNAYQNPSHSVYHHGPHPSPRDTPAVHPAPPSPPLPHKQPSPKRLKLANELEHLRLQQEASGVDDDMTPEQIEAMFAEQEQQGRRSGSPSANKEDRDSRGMVTYTYADGAIRGYSPGSGESVSSSVTTVVGHDDQANDNDHIQGHAHGNDNSQTAGPANVRYTSIPSSGSRPQGVMYNYRNGVITKTYVDRHGKQRTFVRGGRSAGTATGPQTGPGTGAGTSADAGVDVNGNSFPSTRTSNMSSNHGADELYTQLQHAAQSGSASRSATMSNSQTHTNDHTRAHNHGPGFASHVHTSAGNSHSLVQISHDSDNIATLHTHTHNRTAQRPSVHVQSGGHAVRGQTGRAEQDRHTVTGGRRSGSSDSDSSTSTEFV